MRGDYKSRMEGYVAPHAGAWIEIYCQDADGRTEWVAPHAGAWIEINEMSWIR